MEEITCLLARAADPVHFMCQALQQSSVQNLDQKLTSMLLKHMPNGGFQGLQCGNTPQRELHHSDVPSLLHFAAQYGFRSVCSVLLQCPGAGRALHTANRHGHTPTEIAKTHGHTQLHVLLKERLNMFSSGEDNGDASVYEMMCAAGTTSSKHAEPPAEEGEEEDIYLPLEDGYDSILNPTKAVVIANRPPAPTPRPEGTQVKEDGTPYITKVFQKKKTQQGETDLYSLPTKPARGREDSISATYDTFVPKQMSGLQTLIELQQSKGGEEVQQEKLNQLRASIVSSREADDSVYDKINIVHHTPSVTESESRRGSQEVKSNVYSKPLKGQHSNFFSKADKR
ncbi:hypothetical protein CesoFtcFv8_027003 [Champsocephalus esox]|uniref:DBB domain-containing protein n=1 Tax=Champsocephalus esox TaxID=159716 RepID=A0AAN8B0P9_9TELE|nr:hypothetical protein CesoFtcFv8_027003 [Champsocephalus esox]